MEIPRHVMANKKLCDYIKLLLSHHFHCKINLISKKSLYQHILHVVVSIIFHNNINFLKKISLQILFVSVDQKKIFFLYISLNSFHK